MLQKVKVVYCGLLVFFYSVNVVVFVFKAFQFKKNYQKNKRDKLTLKNRQCMHDEEHHGY